MVNKKQLLLFGLLITAFMLTACGGGGDSGGESGGNTATGYFKDSNVSGLSYRSGSVSGVTGEDGSFSYVLGDTVAFSVGGVVLGEAKGKSVITPLDLVPEGNVNSAQVKNIVRFLLLMDKDGNPDNGIQISPAVREIAKNWQQVDFSASDFDDRIASKITDISSADGRVASLAHSNTAYLHMRSTLLCVYAGAYKGRFNGGASGVFGMMVDARNGNIFGVAFSDDEYVELNGDIATYEAQPVFGMEEVYTGTAFGGRFTSPDRISGKWRSTSYSVSGDFSGSRVGGSLNAKYRFTGAYRGDDYGLFAFDIDSSDNITGIAYSLGTDEEHPFTGTLSGTQFQVKTSDGSTAAGTIDKSRGTVSGYWRGNGDGGSFSGSGCRLN